MKIDSNLIDGCTYEYVNSVGKHRIGLSSLKYDTFVDSNQNYINLSAISKVDPYVFIGMGAQTATEQSSRGTLRSISFSPQVDD